MAFRVVCVADFPVYDVTGWLVTDVEPAGDDIKYWLVGAAGESESQAWLFKQATLKMVAVSKANGGGERPYRQGEDWAEKIASELAALICLPAARVQLATRDGHPGLISRDTRPSGWTLASGGVLVGSIDERYAPKTEDDRRANRIGHNLDNVETVLQPVASSPGWPIEHLSAFDQFAGFLLFDAWIANRDRHEINWGVLQNDADGALHLSPSFDHGAALGSGLEDPYRERLLRDSTVDQWCSRATAHRFEDGADLTLLELARDALGRASSEASELWLANVASVSESQWQNVLERVPGLSVGTVTFIDEILRRNQERIINEFGLG